ncbi:MAG: BatD family protein [Isosphaeraceae bacterium]
MVTHLLAATFGMFAGLLSTVAWQAEPEPLTVLAQVRPSSCFVGQGVELTVGVVGGNDRPRVVLPEIPGAEVELVRTEQVPISASAIGDMMCQQSLFRFRYRVVPRRAGTLSIPRVTATLDTRNGSSNPLRLTVREVPHAGRPATFLGGIGTFEVEAAVEPGSVRTGQTLDYRLTIRGPAARGIEGPPSMSRLATLPLGLRVERRPDLVSSEPPSRTFVFRLRPGRPGQATLPPVAVSSFDPASGQFVTRVSKGVPIQVSEVPAFDPARLEYPAPEADTVSSPTRRALVGLAGAGLATGSLVVLGRWWLRRRHAPRRALKQLARRYDSELVETIRPEQAAHLLAAFLVDYLRLTTDRPPGALTPDDAATGVREATRRDDLANQASELMARCDRILYGDVAANGELHAAGRALIVGLIEARERVIREGAARKTPREAVDPVRDRDGSKTASRSHSTVEKETDPSS